MATSTFSCFLHLLLFFLFTDEGPGIKKESTILHMGSPDDVDVSIELKNWLFALEGTEEIAEKRRFSDSSRAQRCWHTTFRSLQVKAKSSQRHLLNSREIPYGRKKQAIEYITVSCCCCCFFFF